MRQRLLLPVIKYLVVGLSPRQLKRRFEIANKYAHHVDANCRRLYSERNKLANTVRDNTHGMSAEMIGSSLVRWAYPELPAVPDMRIHARKQKSFGYDLPLLGGIHIKGCRTWGCRGLSAVVQDKDPLHAGTFVMVSNVPCMEEIKVLWVEGAQFLRKEGYLENLVNPIPGKFAVYEDSLIGGRHVPSCRVDLGRHLDAVMNDCEHELERDQALLTSSP